MFLGSSTGKSVMRTEWRWSEGAVEYGKDVPFTPFDLEYCTLLDELDRGIDDL